MTKEQEITRGIVEDYIVEKECAPSLDRSVTISRKYFVEACRAKLYMALKEQSIYILHKKQSPTMVTDQDSYNFWKFYHLKHE